MKKEEKIGKHFFCNKDGIVLTVLVENYNLVFVSQNHNFYQFDHTMN